jgi:hypothetical protein
MPSACPSEPNVKQVVVTGEAAASYTKNGTRRRRTTATTRKAQEGGTSPGTIVQLQANRAPDAVPTVNSAKPSEATALAKNTTNSAPAPVAANAAPVKVILTGGKKQSKVLLAPAKVRKLPGVAQAPVARTRKIAKRIRMSLGGFGKRVTRANTIKKEATKQSLDTLKKTLVEAKLIKADSKAPEGVLRQMYADYMVLKNRAL